MYRTNANDAGSNEQTNKKKLTNEEEKLNDGTCKRLQMQFRMKQQTRHECAMSKKQSVNKLIELEFCDEEKYSNESIVGVK